MKHYIIILNVLKSNITQLQIHTVKHWVFIVDFEYIQHINQVISLSTLNVYWSVKTPWQFEHFEQINVLFHSWLWPCIWWMSVDPSFIVRALPAIRSNALVFLNDPWKFLTIVRTSSCSKFRLLKITFFSLTMRIPSSYSKLSLNAYMLFVITLPIFQKISLTNNILQYFRHFGISIDFQGTLTPVRVPVVTAFSFTSNMFNP